MKVRHRSNGDRDWKVLEESFTYYIAEGDYAPLALKKLECEPVEEFEDVSNIYNGDEAMGLLHSSLYKLTRHEVSKLNKQMKAYAYLLEREKA